MILGEYPVIDELKPQIKMYEELWTLYIKYSKLSQLWLSGPIKSLIPAEVIDEHKGMYRLATRLASKFEQTNPKLTKPM
jgi:hypothetical protein